MIPIRDTHPSRSYPVVTHAIIGVNVAVFLVQITQGPEMERFIYLYGLVPARYSLPQVATYFSPGQQLFSLLSFMFLHGGFLHLLGNMWSLYIFGDNVEDRLGPFRYLLFYLLSGLVSGLAHLLLNFHSGIPTIGASGAIAGVMGAYLLLYPQSRILTLIPIFFIPYFVEIPAFFFLGIWFFLQFLSAAGSSGEAGGVAWWAHVGGFLAGMIFVKLFSLIPATAMGQKVRQVTEKRRTEHFQVVRPSGPGEAPNLYGTIHITPYEAAYGTRKLVNVPWGFYNRIYRVAVPPGTREGTQLRLKGLGKQMQGGQRGDLLLKVVLQGR